MTEGFLHYMGIVALDCPVKGLHDFLRENSCAPVVENAEPSSFELDTVLFLEAFRAAEERALILLRELAGWFRCAGGDRIFRPIGRG